MIDLNFACNCPLLLSDLVNNGTYIGNVRLEAVLNNVRFGNVFDEMPHFQLHQWHSWCGVNQRNQDGTFTLTSYSDGKRPSQRRLA